MLVYGDGTQAGTLGGGCVEAEVKRLALRALTDTQHEPRIHTFMLDDDYGWDDGLICGGRLTVLAEPIHAQMLTYYSAIANLLQNDAGWSEAIALSKQSGRPSDRHQVDLRHRRRIGRGIARPDATDQCG